MNATQCVDLTVTLNKKTVHNYKNMIIKYNIHQLYIVSVFIWFYTIVSECSQWNGEDRVEVYLTTIKLEVFGNKI